MAYDDDLAFGRKSLDGHHAQIVANSSPLKGVEHRVDFIVPKRMIQHFGVPISFAAGASR